MSQSQSVNQGESSESLIQVSRLSKRYAGAAEHEWALRDVSLVIQHGEMVAIRGTSGSGKTTLLNIIGGLDQEFEGEVKVNGTLRNKMNEQERSWARNQEIGFVFQHFSLLDHLTVLDNVMLPATLAPPHLQRSRAQEIIATPQQRALALLDRVGLSDKSQVTPNTLSGGQKQRVAIARALFFEPPLILCDEPTGSLDSKIGQQIIELFQELNAEGYTVVMITHEDRVSQAAKRVVELEDGMLVNDYVNELEEHE